MSVEIINNDESSKKDLSTKKGVYSVHIPPQLNQKARKYCDAIGLTMSALIKISLSTYVQKEYEK